MDWAEIVPSELDRFHERGRSKTARFLTAPQTNSSVGLG